MTFSNGVAPAPKANSPPYAVIIRMKSIEDESMPEKATETLVVIKLAGANSKVVGKVASNKGGNEGAEALADKLCGPQ